MCYGIRDSSDADFVWAACLCVCTHGGGYIPQCCVDVKIIISVSCNPLNLSLFLLLSILIRHGSCFWRPLRTWSRLAAGNSLSGKVPFLCLHFQRDPERRGEVGETKKALEGSLFTAVLYLQGDDGATSVVNQRIR